jgi:hypothetical protein
MSAAFFVSRERRFALSVRDEEKNKKGDPGNDQDRLPDEPQKT